VSETPQERDGQGSPGADTGTASQVSRVLPKALKLSSRKGMGLVDTLRPIVERSIASSARHDPNRLVEALRPVVGPGVRRWISDSFRALLQGINRIVYSLTTFRGWKWRFEAMRTGRTFAEVMRRHTSTWPVQQVLLIHRKTGLLLSEVRSPVFRAQDGDMVSGMLTAIQDFVHDSFAAGSDAEGELETIEMGDMTVWIEQGPAATIAAVIDGKAPPNLRPAFEDALTRIHSRLDRELHEFGGDTAPFERSHPYLEACLDLQSGEHEMRILPLTWLILLGPLAWLAVWGFDAGRRTYLWNSYVDTLKEQPGIVVTDVGRAEGKFYLTGLRDAMASDPAAILAGSGLDPDDVTMHWEPYQAMAPEFIKARIRAALDPPASVALEIKDGVLYVSGTASRAWIAEATALLRGFTRTLDVNTKELRDEFADRAAGWDKYLTALTLTPGIVVLGHGTRDGKFTVSGLRDPLARDPSDILVGSGLDPDDVLADWKPYRALHADIVLARTRQVLAPPDTVDLSVQEGVLDISGQASHAWVTRVSTLAAALPGVAKVVTAGLVDVDVAAFGEAREAVDGEVFRFLKDSPDLWPGQKKRVEDLVENVRELSRLGRRIDRHFAVEIVGHTTATEDEKTDHQVCRAVAQRVLDVLTMQGLDYGLFSTGTDRTAPLEAATGARATERATYVSLKVLVTDE